MSSSKPSPHDRSLVIGTLAGPLTREPDANGQSTLGAVVADGLQFGAKPFDVTVAALVDPADLHADLDAKKPHKGGTPGAVTLADGLAALPLNVTSTVVSATGAQLVAALEAQFAGLTMHGKKADVPALMQVSASVTYQWSATPVDGSHVVASSVAIGGKPVTATAAYVVVLSDGLRDPRKGNAVLRGLAPVAHGVTGVGGAHPGPLFDNLAAYLSTRPALAVPTTDRATRIG